VNVSARLCELLDTKFVLQGLSKHRQVTASLDPTQARLNV